MNCPDCDEEMERETKADESGVSKNPDFASEYFCLKDKSSWYWTRRGGLQRIGTSLASSRDVVEAYAHMAVDDNGQVW